jgi:hypothetical protein
MNTQTIEQLDFESGIIWAEFGRRRSGAYAPSR